MVQNIEIDIFAVVISFAVQSGPGAFIIDDKHQITPKQLFVLQL